MLDSTNIRVEGFHCFKSLFLTVNAEKRYIDLDNSGGYQVNQLGSLTGLETLWEIVIHCNDEDVLSESRILLVDLHAKTKPGEKEKRPYTALNQFFAQKVFEVNQSLTEQVDRIGNAWQLNWVKLIHCYIDRFDFEHIEEESVEDPKFNPKDNIQIMVTLEPEKIQEQVVVN